MSACLAGVEAGQMGVFEFTAAQRIEFWSATKAKLWFRSAQRSVSLLFSSTLTVSARIVQCNRLSRCHHRSDRHRGVVAFAVRSAKELGADATIVLSHGTEYAGTISTGSAFTSGQFYGSGFNATTTGTSFSRSLVFGKASIITIRWR